MNYLVDFDSLKVESKSDNREELDTFVSDQGLSLALCIISSPDDLVMEMTIEEITKLNANVSGKPRDFEDESDASRFTFSILNKHEDEFPKFSKSKSLAANKKINKDSAEANLSKPDKKSKKPDYIGRTASKRITAKQLAGKMIGVGLEPAPRGRHGKIVQFVEDELGEVLFEDLCLEFSEEKDGPEKHICWAINRDILKIVEEEDEL